LLRSGAFLAVPELKAAIGAIAAEKLTLLADPDRLVAVLKGP
jgi:hypothetical protein